MLFTKLSEVNSISNSHFNLISESKVCFPTKIHSSHLLCMEYTAQVVLEVTLAKQNVITTSSKRVIELFNCERKKKKLKKKILNNNVTLSSSDCLNQVESDNYMSH